MYAKRTATLSATFVATILLLVGLAVTAMPAKAHAASSYNLWLAGTQITDESPADVFGDGTALYDASTRTLTLENFVATGEDSGTIGGMLYASETDLTLVLKGENALVGGEGAGIYVNGDLTITGDGTLVVSSGDCPHNYTTAGLSAFALTVDEGFTGTLVATGGSALDGSYGIECLTFTIKGGTVIATGGTAEASAGLSIEESSAINGGVLYAQGGNATKSATYSAGIYGGHGMLRPTVAVNGGVLVARAGLVNGTLDPADRGAFWAAEYAIGENMKVAGEVGYDDGAFYGRASHGTAGDPPVGMVFVPTSWTSTTAASLPAQLTGNVYCVDVANANSFVITETTELNTNGYTALFVRLFEDSSIGGVGLQFRNSVTVSGTGALIGIGGNCPGNAYSMGLSFSGLPLAGAKVLGVSGSCGANGDAIGVSVSGKTIAAGGAIVGVGGTSSKTSTGVSFGEGTTIGGASTVVGVGGTATKTSSGINWPYWYKFTLKDSASMLAAGGLSSSSDSYGVGQTCYEYVPEIGAGTRLAALGGCAPTGTSMGIKTSTSYRGGSYTLKQGCRVATLGGVGAYSYGSSANFYERTLYGDMTSAGRTRAFYRNGNDYEDVIWIGNDCSFTGYADYAGAGQGIVFAGGTFGELAGCKRVVLKQLVKYDLWVAGTQVTGDNAADLSTIDCVTGTASYDADTNTLHLDGATITGGYGTNEYGGAIVYAGTEDFTIKATGNNVVTGDKRKVYSTGLMIADPTDIWDSSSRNASVVIDVAKDATLSFNAQSSENGYYLCSMGICDMYSGDMTIRGAGTLTAIGADNDYSYGIDVAGHLAIEGPGTVNASAGEGTALSAGIVSGTYVGGGLKVSGGTVNATGAAVTGVDSYSGSHGIDCYGTVEIAGGSVTARAGAVGLGNARSYGISEESGEGTLAINGGSVLAVTASTTEKAAALNVAPTLGAGISAAASVNANGKGSVAYVAADNAGYRWFKAPAGPYKVSFAAGGGKGTMAAVTGISHGATYTLPKCTFTPPSGKVFDKWDKGAAGAKITVTGDVTVTAKWKDATASITKATVTAASQTYTGAALTPAPTVTLGDKTLKAGTDYTVAYKDNTSAGTATVTVTGKGNYTGTATGTFAIAPASLAKATVTAAAQTYTGSALTPAPTVKLGGKTLAAGTDYAVAYKDNVEVGTATVTATGKGNYTGTATGTFQISAAPQPEPQPKAADTTALEAAIASVPADLSPYTDESASAVTKAKAAAEALLGATADQQAKVDAAAKALSDAVKALEQKPAPGPAPDSAWTRLAGDDRFGTMKAITLEGYDKADTVLVATGIAFADALAAAGLSGVLDAPIVTTMPGFLSDEAKVAIQKLGAKEAIILGGEAAVSADVEKQLKAMGLTTSRLAGDNRVDTAVRIWKRGGDAWGGTCILSKGWVAADALAAGSFAYVDGAPLFLALPDGTLTPDTAAALKTFDHVVVLGGTGGDAAIKDKTAKSLGVSWMRVAGDTRYETATALATWASGNDDKAAFQPETTLSWDDCAVAFAWNYPDALVGVNATGPKASVTLLASTDVDEFTQGVADAVSEHADEVTHGYVLGGTSVVSDAVMKLFEAAAK